VGLEEVKSGRAAGVAVDMVRSAPLSPFNSQLVLSGEEFVKAVGPPP